MAKLLLKCLLFTFISLITHQVVEASSLGGRIVGGYQIVDIKYHPYQVSIEYNYTFRCGGSIIGNNWILTGAYCLEPSKDPSDFRVRYGTALRGVGNILEIARLVPHYNYTKSTFASDIALIELADPVIFSVFAQPVALPDNADVVVEGAEGTVTGWGAQVESGFPVDFLKVVHVPVFNLTTCRERYEYYTVADKTFCAGQMRQDACTGDQGGPLVIDDVQAGVVSWAVGCGRAQYPRIYTNVGLFRDWITEQTGI